jgi:hypothetical protein
MSLLKKMKKICATSKKISLLSLAAFVACGIVAACGRSSGGSASPTGGLSVQSPYAGTWTAPFSGDDQGTVTAIVAADGSISGSGTSLAGSFSVNGTVNADGGTGINATVGGSNTGATFTGKLSTDGTGSGVWSNVNAGMSGVWTAHRP